MTFARLLSEATAGPLPRTGDVLAIGLPLLADMQLLHDQGLVTGAAGVSAVDFDGTRVRVRSSQPLREQLNRRAIDAVAARSARAGFEVASHRHHDLTTAKLGGRVTSLDVVDADDGRPERPVFVRGYRVWEQLHGHHDQITDMAMVGQWLCSYAFGLDLDTPDGIDELAQTHRHPSRLNAALHPVVAGALVDMINPDRARRPAEISQVITRLEHHRDLPADLDLSAAYLPDTDWRRAVLTTLRDRVFDTTRRNRELHYRPTASSVSLTESSVPLMLNVERIQPKDLLTWTEPSNKALRKGKEVDLATWCRFEETPYLAPGLDKLISAERKFRVESGHGRLRLIIAFLRWHDPENGESVVSPLLTLPVVLTRKKGVETRYRLSVPDEPAAVNAVLRHVMATRFDIALPETAGTDHASIVEFTERLEQMVRATAPAVSIELIDRPRIDRLRRKAQLRVDTYRRKRARNLATSGRWRRQDHSYDLDDWRPLGHALYQRFVLPSDIPLRDIAAAQARPRARMLNSEAVDTMGERTSQAYALSGNDTSAQRWQVDLCSVTLSTLGSRRTNLARDYDEVLAGNGVDVKSTPFEPLFRPEPSRTEGHSTEPMHVRQRLVLPADDAQARAVQRALAGDSFIIQGPPGTGKSQTITNVIAALAADGKRVLFVCEKRAAIDVVSHRLRQIGLDELTATIHDSQLDRKDFAKSLGATYHSWLEQREGGSDPEDGVKDEALPPSETRRSRLLAQIDDALRPLEALTAELGRGLSDELTLGAAIERLAHLESVLSPVAPDPETAPKIGIEATTWLGLRPSLDRVQDALASAGLIGSLGTHSALRIRPEHLVNVDPINVCRELGRALSSAPESAPSSSTEVTLAQLAEVVGELPLLRAAATSGAGAALDRTTPQHLDLRAAAQRQSDAEHAVLAGAEVLERWSRPLTTEDTKAGLEIALAKEESLFRFMNRRWRSLVSVVELAYSFEAHQVRPTFTTVLEELQQVHESAAALESIRGINIDQFGDSDAVAIRDLVDRIGDNAAFRLLIDAGPRFDQLADEFESLNDNASKLLIHPETTLHALGDLAAQLEGAPVAAERALVVWAELQDADSSTLAAVLDGAGSLDKIEAQILRAELERWEQTIDHHAFSGPRVDEAVVTLRRLYGELQRCNADVVVEQARAQFLGNVAHSEASMAGRSDEDKELKRAYKAGRRAVEREHEKKIRHRSIREMSGGESGRVVRDLRPIWLMSPLSVSDTLPLEADLFDVVIFDEASQIPVEDAMPSVFRAPQVIVVGDRMQMPPTKFFSSEDDDESEVLVDDQGHRLSISLNADSFLTQADLALDSSMLNWHYRSRYESLIAYSNHAFYAGRLATVPDTAIPAGELDKLSADDTSDAQFNTQRALERPISFHHVQNGEYRDRRNTPEADYIAEMVRNVLRSGSGMTIGVVAFSEAQQGAIESSLEELAAIDTDFAQRYERELQRTEDDEFVGLFVKNLENVQGDERDLVIMSVCYGPDSNGQIRMNFGPINNAGGERRLNVIFSRARQHMAVVSSMHGNQITNLHNEGAAHLAGFLSYAAAESQGDTRTSTALLRSQTGGLENGAERSAVAQQLAAALREKGWTVDAAVGRSGFQVDVALAIEGSYRLGVLLEPEGGAGTTARYIAEAGVLEAFGWSIMRVPLSDWLVGSGRVVERVDAAARVAEASVKD